MCCGRLHVTQGALDTLKNKVKKTIEDRVVHCLDLGDRQVLGPSPLMSGTTAMKDYEAFMVGVQEAFIRTARIPKWLPGGIS
jgi:hypothetical protein